MARTLETETLDNAAKFYASEWLRDVEPIKTPSGKLWRTGRPFVLQEFYKHDFKDEHEHLVKAVKANLGGKALADFEKAAKEHFKPREDKVFAKLLKDKLAVDPNGKHIDGAIGTTQLGNRIVGVRHRIVKTKRFGEVRIEKLLHWPVYAGEPEEREAGSSRPDPLPEGADPWPVVTMHATNPNISAAAAILMVDALVDDLDIGATAATIRGRTGTQPADPDATETGTLLFTLTMSATAFGGAADNADGTITATAASITDDSSADATNTLTYCRVGATGAGADDTIDGSAGTASADFIFNTTSIVSGSTVSMSSFTVTLPQGATAT